MEPIGRLGAPWSLLGDGSGDKDDLAWTSWDGEDYVSPEQRIAFGRETNGALLRLAQLTQRLLDGTATDDVVSEAQRLVDNVLRPPAEHADPGQTARPRPS